MYLAKANSAVESAMDIAAKRGYADAPNLWAKACTSGAGLKEAADAASTSFDAARESGAGVETVRALADRFQFLAYLEEAHRLFGYADEEAMV